MMRSSVSEGWRASVSARVAKWPRSRSETCSSALKIVALSATATGSLLVEALAQQLGGDLVQARSLLHGRGAHFGHQVALQLAGERDEAQLAVVLALRPAVAGIGGSLAVAIGGA